MRSVTGVGMSIASILRPGEGERAVIGFISARNMIAGEADGRFSLVEHPLEPRALAAPLH